MPPVVSTINLGQNAFEKPKKHR